MKKILITSIIFIAIAAILQSTSLISASASASTPAATATNIDIQLKTNQPVSISISFPKPTEAPHFHRQVYSFYKEFETINTVKNISQGKASLSYEVEFKEETPSIVSGSEEDGRYFLYAQSLLPVMTDPELYPARVCFNKERASQVTSNYPKTKDGCFTFRSQKELLDSVFWVGDLHEREFKVGESNIRLVFTHDPGNTDDMVAKISSIIRFQTSIFNDTIDEDYTFFIRDVREKRDFYQGLEYRNSSVIHIPDNAVATETAAFYGLVAHEFFHRWNIKRMAPREYVMDEDGTLPIPEELWFIEGVTKYYETLSLYNAGIIEEEEFLRQLGGFFKDSSAEAKRKKVFSANDSLTESAEYYDQIIKGASIAFLLDISIRESTDGNAGLNDLLAVLYAAYGTGKDGYNEEDILASIKDISGLDISEWFTDANYPFSIEFINATVSSIGLQFRMGEEVKSQASGKGILTVKTSTLTYNTDAKTEEKTLRNKFL